MYVENEKTCLGKG